LAHPGRDDDGVRWIAFEAFTSRTTPTSKYHLVAKIRAALSTELLDELSSLDHDLPHHAQFAERSAAWARATAAHIPSTVNPGASTQAFPWLNPRVEYVLRPQQLDADAHASKGAKLPERSKGQQQGDSTFA